MAKMVSRTQYPLLDEYNSLEAMNINHNYLRINYRLTLARKICY